MARRTAAKAAPPAEAVPELMLVDPAELRIGENVRLDDRVDRSFVESIRARGVLEPVVAYVDPDDQALVVLYGRRRTLAALKAGRARIPVMVVPKPATADRLVDQVVENDHREALTQLERVAAYEQLAALGLSAAQIATKTATPRGQVDAGLVMAGSEVARAAMQELPAMTIGQAAVVAEFAGDEAAVAKLTAAARDGGFDHKAQQLRDDRADRQAAAAAAQPLIDAGVTVVDRPARHWEHRLDAWKVTLEEHGSCPGHAVYMEFGWYYGDDDGEVVPDGVDEEGSASEPKKVWEAVFICRDPKGNGHEPRFGSSYSGRTRAADLSDAEREKAAAERRDVIESNRAWASAQTVRREWLRQFLARKTAPKGTAAFVAESLARLDHVLREYSDRNALAHELLGLAGYDSLAHGKQHQMLAPILAAASEQRAQVLLLALVLGAYEAGLARDAWRRRDHWQAWYLRHLEQQGYELSEVELRACGVKPKAGKKTAARAR